jgi:hypothetical protein
MGQVYGFGGYPARTGSSERVIIMAKESIPLQKARNHIQEDIDKMEELRASDKIEDQLTLVLMEPHVGEPFTEESDSSGLWYTFARAKALAILKRFNVQRLS